MNYCKFCGTEMEEGVSACPGCGKAVSQTPPEQEIITPETPNTNDAPQQHVTVNINNPAPQPVQAEVEGSGLKTAAKVFMVLGIIASGWMLIPLAWTIPMTVSVFHDFRDGRPVGMGLKICSLLFVSLIGGILLLCIHDKKA